MKFSTVACVLGLLVSGSYANRLKGANTEGIHDRTDRTAADVMATKARNYLSGLTRESIVQEIVLGKHAHEMTGSKALEIMKSTGSAANQVPLSAAGVNTTMIYSFSMSYSMFCVAECPGYSYWVDGDYATYCDVADASCFQENCGDIGEAFLNYLCDCLSYDVFESYSYIDLCDVSEDCAASTLVFWFGLFSLDYSFSNYAEELVQVACNPFALCSYSYSYDGQLDVLFSLDQTTINYFCDCTDWSHSFNLIDNACLDETCFDSLVDFVATETSYSFSYHFWVEAIDSLCVNVTAFPTMEPTTSPGTTNAPTMESTAGGNAGSVVSAGVASFLAVFAATAAVFTF